MTSRTRSGDPWDLVEARGGGDALAAVLGRAEAAEPGSVAFAEAWHHVGVLARYAGRYDDAAVALALARPAAEAHELEEPGLLADVLHAIAALDHARGCDADAEPVARRGREVRRRSGDPDGVAADVAALAAILEGLERWDEAEALYRQALIHWAASGDRYEAALATNGLAAVLCATGRTGEAETGFRTALGTLAAVRGPAHPDTSMVRVNLALLLESLGRSLEATALLERAVADLDAAVGVEHPLARRVRAELGRVQTRSS